MVPEEGIEPTLSQRCRVGLFMDVNSSHMAKRAFSPDDTPVKAQDYHGGCRFARLSPDVASKGIKSVNVELPLDEALKLHLALDSCLLAVNRYNRSTVKGKSMGVVLSIKTESGSIAVIEATVRDSQRGQAG